MWAMMEKLRMLFIKNTKPNGDDTARPETATGCNDKKSAAIRTLMPRASAFVATSYENGNFSTPHFTGFQGGKPELCDLPASSTPFHWHGAEPGSQMRNSGRRSALRQILPDRALVEKIVA